MKRVALFFAVTLAMPCPAFAADAKVPGATAYVVECYSKSVCVGLAQRGSLDATSFDVFVRAYARSEVAVLSEPVTAAGVTISTMTGLAVAQSADPKHLLTQIAEIGVRFVVTPSKSPSGGFDYSCVQMLRDAPPPRQPRLGERGRVYAPATSYAVSGSVVVPAGDVVLYPLAPGTFCALEQP